jgi:hypothetical protein
VLITHAEEPGSVLARALVQTAKLLRLDELFGHSAKSASD